MNVAPEICGGATTVRWMVAQEIKTAAANNPYRSNSTFSTFLLATVRQAAKAIPRALAIELSKVLTGFASVPAIALSCCHAEAFAWERLRETTVSIFRFSNVSLCSATAATRLLAGWLLLLAYWHRPCGSQVKGRPGATGQRVKPTTAIAVWRGTPSAASRRDV